MTRFAADTSVPADRSRAEIERTLQRYGAKRFVYGWEDTHALVAFEMADRRIRFILPLPDRNDREFTHTPTRGERRTPDAAEKAWEQATRQRWRALLLVIKAKLEAVESGITSFEDEFLAHIVLPGGGTVGEHVRPRVAQAYLTGRLEPLLPALPAGDQAAYPRAIRES